MTTKEILLAQFIATYDENAWFVALKNTIQNLTAEQANWKPAGIEHSARETVNHLIYWNERWLKRFRNEQIEDAPEIAQTFFGGENEPDFTEKDWADLVQKLYKVFDALKAVLENIDEAKLNEQVSEKYEAPWSAPFANMNIHNAYHIGQIVIVRKLQGSWNPKQGVAS